MMMGIIYVKCLAHHRLSVKYGRSGGADGDNGVGVGADGDNGVGIGADGDNGVGVDDDDGERDGGGADLKIASEL